TGLAVAQSPPTSATRSPRIPAGDRRIVGCGAGGSPTDDLTIDVAYSYLREDEPKIRDSSPSNGSYSADYRNTAHGLGTSVTYRF
ncbi:transporter, partial [Pseudomonas syringae]